MGFIMQALKFIWDSLLTVSTAWQAIRHFMLARSQVFKAENIREDQPIQPMPIVDEQVTPYNCAVEYFKATINMAQGALYIHTALDTVVQNCGAEQYVPGMYFCRYIHPIGTALATAQTAYQVGSYLNTKLKPN
jgi:hypothetical protein